MDESASSSRTFISSGDVSGANLSASLNQSFQPKYRVSMMSGGSGSRTPGSNNSANSSRSLRSYTVMAILDGRGTQKSSFGIATIDLRFPDVEITEFVDSSSFVRLKSKVRVDDPIEVILPESFADCSANRDQTQLHILIEMFRVTFPGTAISTVQRRFYNSSRGVNFIEVYANKETSNCSGIILKKHLATGAALALVKYVEHIQNWFFAPKSLRFTYRDVEKICMIDAKSLTYLEILDMETQMSDKKNRRSLLAVVDNTLTSVGSKLLRSFVLQPSSEEAVINERLDAVEELLDDPMLLERLRAIISRVSGLEQLLGFCVRCCRELTDSTMQTAERSISQVLVLAETIRSVEPLRAACMHAKSSLLNEKCRFLRDPRTDAIVETLLNYLDLSVLSNTKKSSINVRNQRCFVVKAGHSVYLDVARKAYGELMSDMQTHGNAELASAFKTTQNMRVAYSATRGCHYLWICTNASTAVLPKIFMKPVRNRSSITFTSRSLMRFNDRIQQSVTEVLVESNKVLQTVIEEIRPHIAVLYYIVDAVAVIDVLCSYAFYAGQTDTVRPSFDTAIVIKDGRHPLLDYALGNKVVPNDTYMPPDGQFSMITGPNMAGKSTYLRQICQLAVLAQAGCVVPASYIQMPVFMHIFSRIGHNDDLTAQMSAFALEMSEMAVILEYASEKSLIVIDELARSTSTEEGLAICFATIEHLIAKKCFTLFATHFLDLAMMDVMYSCVENFHFSQQSRVSENGTVVWEPSHRIYTGPYAGPLYGFELAELASFPRTLIDNAYSTAQKLRNEAESRRKMDRETAMQRVLIRNAYRLRNCVTHAPKDNKTGTIRYLKDMQSRIRKMLADVDEMYPESGEEQQEDEENSGDEGENQSDDHNQSSE